MATLLYLIMANIKTLHFQRYNQLFCCEKVNEPTDGMELLGRDNPGFPQDGTPFFLTLMDENTQVGMIK